MPSKPQPDLNEGRLRAQLVPILDKGLVRVADLGPDWSLPSLAGAPLSEDESVQLAKMLAALADPVRLRLMSLVASNPDLTSSELEGPLGRSQPTISHHCRVLVEAGLLTGEQRGRWTHWRIDSRGLAALRYALE
jgi:ArsR family transcriptional regulator